MSDPHSHSELVVLPPVHIPRDHASFNGNHARVHEGRKLRSHQARDMPHLRPRGVEHL